MINQISSPKAIASIAKTPARAGDKPEDFSARSGASGSPATLSKLISMARSLADQGPPIDGAKVARVRQALADGTYRIDVEALANAMLRDSDKENK